MLGAGHQGALHRDRLGHPQGEIRGCPVAPRGQEGQGQVHRGAAVRTDSRIIDCAFGCTAAPGQLDHRYVLAGMSSTHKRWVSTKLRGWLVMVLSLLNVSDDTTFAFWISFVVAWDPCLLLRFIITRSDYSLQVTVVEKVDGVARILRRAAVRTSRARTLNS